VAPAAVPDKAAIFEQLRLDKVEQGALRCTLETGGVAQRRRFRGLEADTEVDGDKEE